jgi:hypothetical protein
VEQRLAVLASPSIAQSSKDWIDQTLFPVGLFQRDIVGFEQSFFLF